MVVLPMTEPHFPLGRLATDLRADGIQCDILPGAQGRSARRFTDGYYVGCQAVVQHHSVSSGFYPENDIEFILHGKGEGYVIANAYTGRYGKVTLIASGPTYTEGTGGPWGIIPANRANDVAFSNEIASWGAEDSAYPTVQQDAVLALGYHAGRIAAEVWDWADDPYSPHRAFSHFEWAPGRKIDPRGVSRWSPAGGMWDMDAFRRDMTEYRKDDPTVDTLEYILMPPESAAPGSPWIYVCGPHARYLNGIDRDFLVARGIPKLRDTAERYAIMKASLGL